MNTSVRLLLCGLFASSALQAEVYELFTSNTGFFTGVAVTDPDAGWEVTNAPVDLGAGSTLHMWDNSNTTGNVKLRGNLPAPVLGLFHLSFYMLTTNTDAYGPNSDAFKIRIGNDVYLPDIATQGDTAISFEPRMDNNLTIKSNPSSSDVKLGTGFLDPGLWYRVDVVGNFNPTGGSSLGYTLDSMASSLSPQSQDVWIGGVKVASNLLFQGSQWLVDQLDPAYPGALSVGFLTDSNKLGGDWYFDNVFVFTEDDVGTFNAVPEPATYAGIFGLVVLGAALQRRRRAAQR